MHKYIIPILFLLLPIKSFSSSFQELQQNSNAFYKKIADAKKQEQKIKTLEQMKKWVKSELKKTDRSKAPQKHDPGLYLMRLDSYLNIIDTKKFNKKDCEIFHSRIYLGFNGDPETSAEVPEEAQMALDILQQLCAKG